MTITTARVAPATMEMVTCAHELSGAIKSSAICNVG